MTFSAKYKTCALVRSFVVNVFAFVLFFFNGKTLKRIKRPTTIVPLTCPLLTHVHMMHIRIRVYTTGMYNATIEEDDPAVGSCVE